MTHLESPVHQRIRLVQVVLDYLHIDDIHIDSLLILPPCCAFNPSSVPSQLPIPLLVLTRLCRFPFPCRRPLTLCILLQQALLDALERPPKLVRFHTLIPIVRTQLQLPEPRSPVFICLSEISDGLAFCAQAPNTLGRGDIVLFVGTSPNASVGLGRAGT